MKDILEVVGILFFSYALLIPFALMMGDETDESGD